MTVLQCEACECQIGVNSKQTYKKWCAKLGLFWFYSTTNGVQNLACFGSTLIRHRVTSQFSHDFHPHYHTLLILEALWLALSQRKENNFGVRFDSWHRRIHLMHCIALISRALLFFRPKKVRLDFGSQGYN